MWRFIALVALLLLAGCSQSKPVKPARPQVTVVVYTATWCKPCQEAKPALRRIRDAGVRMQEVDCSRSAPPGITSVPHYVVYDAQGKVVGEAGSITALLAILKALGIILPLLF